MRATSQRLAEAHPLSQPVSQPQLLSLRTFIEFNALPQPESQLEPQLPVIEQPAMLMAIAAIINTKHVDRMVVSFKILGLIRVKIPRNLLSK
jgi:hypothetical protein